jgi:hypothetical protein
MEEIVPGVWAIKTALLSFVQMNSAHHGECLDQALFKVVNHLKIVSKIGHVTCDNATNMDSMMMEFSAHIKQVTDQPWNT